MASWPIVESIINTEPLEIGTPISFDTALTEFPDHLSSWKASIRQEAIESTHLDIFLDNEVLVTLTGEHSLDLAATVYTPQTPATAYRFGILHVVPDFAVDVTEIIRSACNRSNTKTNLIKPTLNNDLSRLSVRLIRLLGLDPTMATVEDLDAESEPFICTACIRSRHAGKFIAMTWRDTVQLHVR